jgi:hypothetical protein
LQVTKLLTDLAKWPTTRCMMAVFCLLRAQCNAPNPFWGGCDKYFSIQRVVSVAVRMLALSDLGLR